MKHLHGGHGFGESFQKKYFLAKIQLKVEKTISLVFSQCFKKRSPLFEPKTGGGEFENVTTPKLFSFCHFQVHSATR